MSDFLIEAPVAYNLTGESNPLQVRGDSPRWLRDTVEIFARYLKMERNYDSPPFDAGEDPSHEDFYPYEAYLFHEVARDLIEEDQPTPSRAIGAVCFRNIGTADEPFWTMQWAWFHPFARTRGHLSDFWPELKAKYGNFTVEGPLSSAMKSFLVRHGHLKVTD